MAVICAIISFVYFMLNLPKLKNKNIREKFLFNIIFIICISAFYWFPMISNSLDTEFEVYESGKMATSESVQNSGINLKQLLITKNDGSYVFEFGPHILIMLCFTIAAFRRLIQKMKKEYIFFLVVGLFSTFMATKYFPWKLLGESFSFIQFAWRMLEISCFCFSVVCAINLGIVIKNFKFLDSIVIISISVLYVFALKNYVPTTKDKLEAPKDFDYGYTTGVNTDCLRRKWKK